MVDDFRGRGGSPWGSPPGGGSGNGSGRRGPTPPNIDELIKNLQDSSRRSFWWRKTNYFWSYNFSYCMGTERTLQGLTR